MGDPAGIGPEVILKALADPSVPAACLPFILGDYRVLETVRKLLKLDCSLELVDAPPDVPLSPGGIAIMGLSDFDPEADRGRPDRPGASRAMIRYIEEGIDLAREKKIEALVTGPVPKSAFQAAGGRHSGHTEFLADRSGGGPVAMMFVGGPLRVALATIHLPLAEAIRVLSRERIRSTLRLIDRDVGRLFGIPRPRIAVTGVNPHAGEDGLLGREEIEMIRPAIEEAVREGVNAFGPYPADALFPRARSGEFDCILAMYHDQGLAPFKTLYFSEGVNVTLGLPFIRTSPDHGTATDIAGKGLADPTSMRNAVLLASEMAARAGG